MKYYDDSRMTPGSSTLLLSDFHAGHHHGHRDRKFRALAAMMLQAREFHVGEVVLAGDIADERPDREQVREECALLREVIDGHPTIFLRGNHDDESFFATHEMEELLRCQIDERPWHVSPISGVVITHGHHFRTRAIQDALRHATHAAHLDGLVGDARSIRHQKAMTKGFSMAGRFGNSLEQAGIPATELWEDLQQVSQRSRSKMAIALRRRKRPPTGLRLWRERIADVIDLRSIRHAARLARTMRCWGVVSGHTHVPGLYKHHLTDEMTGERIPFLVANSGSFVSRYAPTFIEVRHPTMTLWQYDEQTDRMNAVQVMELTADELAAQTRFFNVDNPQGVLVDNNS